MRKYEITIRQAQVIEEEKETLPEILAIDLSVEQQIDEENYSCDITIGITPTDGIAPNFSKTITVISQQKMDGYEVDAQREKAISDFMELINK